MTQAASLALLCTVVLLLPTPARAESDPGRLLNLAQQQLATGEVDEAIASLHQAIEARPEESYAWGLLAEALAWGKAEGPELVAAWEALAEKAPEDGHRVVRVVRARMAVHRRDKFTNATTEWVATSEAALAELGRDGSADLTVRHGALITLRDLLYRSERPSEAIAVGVEAYELDPVPLQGRISWLQWSLQQGDLAATTDACLQILSTDPWAAEACGGLFAWNGWTQPPEDVSAARNRVLVAVASLEPRGLEDLVLGNELLKFWDRSKNLDGKRAWMRSLVGVSPSYRLLDNARWWRGTFIVPTDQRTLFAGTNRAHNHDDPSVRLARLLALAGDVGDDDAGLSAQRWRWRVAESALASTPPDTAEARRRLERIVALDPGDARGWMELADLLEPEPAIEALLAAESAVFSADWDPWERYGSLSFTKTQERRALFVADLRLRRARRLREAGEPDAAWALALEAAWEGPHLADAWPLVAEMAVANERPDFARDADISWLAGRLAEDDVPAADTETARAAIGRYGAVHPEARTAAEVWSALLAAASQRAELNQPQDDEGPRETHPLVGQAMPGLEVQTLSGAARALDDLKGRVVIVDFWATWCAPCKRALPELQAASERLGDEPVTFLLVSVDATRDKPEQFMEDSSYSMDPVWAPEGRATQKSWVVKGIPSTFVIDREGVVRFHHQGYERGSGDRILSEVRTLLR
ncbi:MAG: redoxin domain-containing protein [Deltaproteobacteria bacterium]|nr:redoxin domain-containing protein [Deltaproteobacteria bacterium]